MGLFDREMELLRTGYSGLRISGRVREITGSTILAEGLPLPIGALGGIRSRAGGVVSAQVVGFREGATLLAPFSEPLGIAPGDEVTGTDAPQYVAVGEGMLGRVFNGMGEAVEAGDARADSASPVSRSVGTVSVESAANVTRFRVVSGGGRDPAGRLARSSSIQRSVPSGFDARYDGPSSLKSGGRASN